VTFVFCLQVKNRLDPAYDSAKSAGYRDVLVTLRLVNEETVSMNVETHICELQLILAPFYELKVRQDNTFAFCRQGRSHWVTFVGLSRVWLGIKTM